MKKMFLMAAAAVFMMSCSGDDAEPTNNPGETAILVKKIIETDEDGTITSTLVYDGSKLVQINRTDGTKDVLTYAGDLITEWKELDENNIVMVKETYQYNAQNKLTTYIYLDYAEEWFEKYVYTHNADGTINYDSYRGDSDTTITDPSYSGKIYTNKFEENVPASGDIDAHINTTTYTYDNKNYPFKNITGFDKIPFAGTTEGTTYDKNITAVNYSNTLGNNQLLSSTVYTYNSDQFPITAIETNHSNANAQTTTQYFYE